MKRMFQLIFVLLSLSSLTSCLYDGSDGADPGVGELIKPDGTYHSPDGKATLIVSGNCRILKLSGTAGERGYGYGYLLAAEIIELINNYSVYLAGTHYREAYDKQSLCDWTAWGNEYIDELQGMYDGINDVLNESQRRVYPHNEQPHALTLTDLKMLNTIADWADAFACSSFAVWGAGRSDGSSLMARNLDYFYDPEGIITKSHVIIAYDLPSGRKWVSVAFTGIIGCISGMNDDGTSMIMQNTNCYTTTDAGGFIPKCLAQRRVLETVTAAGAPADTETMFDAMPVYQGNNFLLCFKSGGRNDDDVAAVIENDGKADHPDGRATQRKPSDNSSLPFSQDLNFNYGMINTNHYLKRKTTAGSADSAGHYLSIKDNLIAAKSDGDVDLAEAQTIMKLVGGTKTLHTTIFEPDGMKMHIYLAEPGKGAFDWERHDFNFADFF